MSSRRPHSSERRPTLIVEYIRYAIDASRNDEFEDAYRRAGALLDGLTALPALGGRPLR
jgi:hypothetical protein